MSIRFSYFLNSSGDFSFRTSFKGRPVARCDGKRFAARAQKTVRYGNCADKHPLPTGTRIVRSLHAARCVQLSGEAATA